MRRVYRFAENAEGNAYPVDIDGCVWRIFVPGGCAIVRANAETDTLHFLRILSHDPSLTFQPLLDEPEGDEDD